MTAVASTVTEDREFDEYLQRIQGRLSAHIGPLFTTDASDLFGVFLDALPESQRQYHTCNACRRFIDTFGGLVAIDDDGATQSVFWHDEDTPDLYQIAVQSMRKAIQKARITGVFYSNASVWGTPVTGVWHHFAATPPNAMIFRHLVLSAGQMRAEKREDYTTLQRALVDFTPDLLTTATTLLKTDSLYRSEKVLGVAEWLLSLHQRRSQTKDTRRRDAITWRAVATAPAGYCHPRSSMIGTLLEDLASGLSFEAVSKRFASKMHPLQYQRPQAAPSAGNIQHAERVIAQLQAQNALLRRFARLEDIEALWTPTPAKPQQPTSAGVFGHLAPKHAKPATAQMTPPPTTMTWEKFQRTVLPTAQSMQFSVPHGRAAFTALVTAVDPNAPLIFQWNNPVSWYVWHNGAPASQFGLNAGTYCTVNAITFQPSMWGDTPLTHQGESVIFILDGAQDTNNAGAAIFPETLRSEFHAIRSTIEAYSRSATIADQDQASACGILLRKNSQWQARFRVTTTDGATLDYILDRWD